MQNICVYCGSSAGSEAAFREAAVELGRLIGRANQTLVYGGARVGLMGAVADSALAAGGRVIGVIPEALVDREIVHQHLTERIVVQTMHERKAAMADRADAFIALPGGIGTIEEFLEICTWGQLGLHGKPYGVLNVSGFYDPLFALLDHLAAKRFLRPEQTAMIQRSVDPADLLAKLARFKPAYIPKWIDTSVGQAR